MDKVEALSFLEAARSEVDLVLNSNKSAEVKKVYLHNASRYIGMVEEWIKGEEISE